MSSKTMQFATYKRMLSVMWWRHGEDYVGLQHPGMYSAIPVSETDLRRERGSRGILGNSRSYAVRKVRNFTE